MEKTSNWFSIAKMWKAPEEDRDFKKRACIFTSNFTLRQFSVSACAVQPIAFSVSRTSTANRLFQTNNWLKYGL